MNREQAIRLAIEALLNSAADMFRLDYQEAAQVLSEELQPPAIGISVSDEISMGDRPRD